MTHPSDSLIAGHLLVQCLIEQGVTHAFGVPGESYLAVLDGFHRYREQIRFIINRQEGGAAFMAEAHGKLTGRPGVCFVTRGPGATNASIGVHVAFQDSTPRILLTEVLPNVMPQLIVIATLEAASAILLEAALSFLGLGVQPPLPSWGLMISEAKAYMFFSFWLIAIPGSALALLIFAINLAGDGLHQVLTPSGRG